MCAGGLLRGALATGQLAMPGLPEGTELYDSYLEMALANGVDPDHAVLELS
ncbi:hypothetical protein AB0C81_28825 [Streptomyces roseoverticillatus]|uniref:hypothetical protein n=1 Tax=Streptomyces roseoverticillatus TaxID=66429 RepID=UPI0033C1FB89